MKRLKFDGPFRPEGFGGRLRRQYECRLPAAPPLVPLGTIFAPLGSVSLDFRVTAFPYKSSSLATPAEPGALWALSGVLHDTKDKRRAVYSVP